jgi:peptidoglycan DL-endopeptidase CwlO
MAGRRSGTVGHIFRTYETGLLRAGCHVFVTSAGRWYVPGLMRRGLVAGAGALVVALLAGVIAIAPASAGSIEDKRAEAARIAQRLEDLQEYYAILEEDYAEASVRLEQVSAEVLVAQQELATTEAAIGVATTELTATAVQAYVHAQPSEEVFEVLVSGVDVDAPLRTAYQTARIGDQRIETDQLDARREDVDIARGRLEERQREESAIKADLATKAEAINAAAQEADDLLARTNEELKELIRQEEERRRIAAERAARAAAEAAAAARAAAARNRTPANPGGGGGGGGGDGGESSGGGGAPAPEAPRRVPPPPSGGAAGAVESAMAMIGAPYRWATADPNAGFDCSGLVSWAWGQNGRSLPRSSRAMFNALPGVALEDIQPGDLVFFGNPVHHVGMYIGGGQMVHSPQRGETVTTASIYRRDMAGIGRP